MAEMYRYLRLMGRMTESSGILECVRTYLWSWSRERVRNLPKMDGGCAPFDDLQQPIEVYAAGDVHRVSVALHSQFITLRARQIELMPDILELDLFFFFADQLLDRLRDRVELDGAQAHSAAKSLD
jgi:hypothetical protein